MNKTLFQMYKDTYDEIGSVSEDLETVLRVILENERKFQKKKVQTHIFLLRRLKKIEIKYCQTTKG